MATKKAPQNTKAASNITVPEENKKQYVRDRAKQFSDNVRQIYNFTNKLFVQWDIAS